MQASKFLLRTAALVLFAGCAVIARAEDVAVIVSNTDYRALPDVESELAPSDFAEALDEAGFSVLVLSNGTTDRMHDRFLQRLDELEEADRFLVMVVGHVVTDGFDSWLLGTEARRPNLFDVGAKGLRLSALVNIMAERRGKVGLFVAPAPGAVELGPGLVSGYLPGFLPDGVAVVVGEEEEVIEVVTDDLLRDRLPLGQALADRGGRVIGYGLLPGRNEEVAEDGVDTEAEAWDSAASEDTTEAYRRYLFRFPYGANRMAAAERIAFLRLGPEAMAEQQEAALGLGREDRREIQRNLSILGYDPRGVDGIFGPGTRSAVEDWQSDEGLEVTGFLTGNQVARLQEAAARRQEALEAEARQRQEESDRADAAYWRETGRGETEAGLRDYLSRYPDGLFSGLARGRLDEIGGDRRRSAQAADRDAWETAAAANTPEAYRRYLRDYPDGAFAAEARARISSGRKTEEDQALLDSAQSEEADVLRNPITRLLVERRLQQLDLNPGPADGEFDADTRRAVRNYQRTRDLPVSGYVTQETLVRMLAGN